MMGKLGVLKEQRSLEQVLRMPAGVRGGRNALQPYHAGREYRVKLSTPFDINTVEFNLAHLPDRFSIEFSYDAPRHFNSYGVPAIVLDFNPVDPRGHVYVYESDVALRNLQMLEGGYKGRSDQLLGREFSRIQQLLVNDELKAKCEKEKREPRREEVMNLLYAAAHTAMREWALKNGVLVPGSYVEERGRPMYKDEAAELDVSWLEPRGEPMDALTAYQVVGHLRGFPRSLPDQSGKLASVCEWRNDHHPSDAYISKDRYRRRNERVA